MLTFFIFKSSSTIREIIIFSENGIIEIVGNIILVLCLLRCVQYALQSHIKQGHYFWIASALVFLTVLRRELNHLPDLLIASDFLFLSHPYDWWEDRVLLVLHSLTLVLLIYSWRYVWAVLKNTAAPLYISVAVLALIQYMGENSIGFSHTLGLMVEELSEDMIYAIALFYLLSFKLIDFEERLANETEFELETC